ncbi:GNAT family N-acetyltransferase [Roseateles aquae]|nr:GNAT family N-acetyltransferase [Paucibacter sp. APW11]
MVEDIKALGNRRYRISSAAADQDPVAVHAFLTRCYWSEGISLALVQQAMQHSLCFALRCSEGGAAEQVVGFARVISDRATFAYLCDVYVLEAHRGQGLGDWLIATLLQHPELQGLRRFQLITRDAHALYQRHGFKPLAAPDRGMEISRPGLYLQPAA